jgi:hypothetical protein
MSKSATADFDAAAEWISKEVHSQESKARVSPGPFAFGDKEKSDRGSEIRYWESKVLIPDF